MENKEIEEKIARLQSIPGVGKVLATHVIARLPELGKIEAPPAYNTSNISRLKLRELVYSKF